jgi:hypothetical protein
MRQSAPIRQSAATRAAIPTAAIITAALAFFSPPGAGAARTKLTSAQLSMSLGRSYAPASAFNRPIPANPRLVANSSQIVHRITSWGPPASFEAGAAGTAEDWSRPVYFARFTDPVYWIHQSGWANPDIEGRRIHIPAGAMPAGGGDASFSVVGPYRRWEYDFWDAKAPSGYGGIFKASFGKRGRWWHGSALGMNRYPYRGGTTAAGFSNQAGLIRASEMRSGAINHALFISVRCHYGHIWPADSVGTHGQCADRRGAPAMGQHLWLDMSPAQINALAVPAWQKVILRAMATYGMYVGDDGGAPWALQFESADNYTSFGEPDPWVAYARSHGIRGSWNPAIGRTVYYFNLQHAVDWASRLKVLRPGE